MPEFSFDFKPNADITEGIEFEVPSQMQPSPEPLEWDGWGDEVDKVRFNHLKAANDAASITLQTEVSLEAGDDGWGPEATGSTK